ncbi:hypothetical protein [Gordonia desulfuricans]|uniref:hypothetical protein n=1 Tax=Gordonia desulfuricans TaxID=89051 RepID=UPI001EE4B628|nr:hypothetical protein [Gordonia desulfuricans]
MNSTVAGVVGADAGVVPAGAVVAAAVVGALRFPEITNPTMRTTTQTAIRIQAHTGADAAMRFTKLFIAVKILLNTTGREVARAHHVA